MRCVQVLVAYEMNDEPLARKSGFPARLVIPGFYGTNCVKWLCRLEFRERRATNFMTTRPLLGGCKGSPRALADQARGAQHGEIGARTDAKAAECAVTTGAKDVASGGKSGAISRAAAIRTGPGSPWNRVPTRQFLLADLGNAITDVRHV